MGEYKLTDIYRTKPDFYLGVNQNHCDNSADDTPWIFFPAQKTRCLFQFKKAEKYHTEGKKNS